MKLLNVVNARSLWFVDPRELNPRGKSLFPELIGWLKEEYEFSKAPASALDVSPQGGLAFAGGSFQNEDKELISVELTLFNDGFVANTQSSTGDSDFFLDHVLNMTAETFKLKYDLSMIRKKAYISELNVETNRLIAGLSPKLQGFAAKLNSLFGHEPGVRFEASAIAFVPDPTLQVTRPTGFTFERKINTAYSEGKYYSQAPLDTDTHLTLLNELEDLFSV